MLLNDTMLHDDSYRTGTSDTPVCECASERETVEHFLIRCPRYKQFRSDLISTVQEIGTSSKFKSHLHLSTNLLVDLPCDLPCAASLAGIQPVRPRAQRTSP